MEQLLALLSGPASVLAQKQSEPAEAETVCLTLLPPLLGAAAVALRALWRRRSLPDSVT